MIDLIENFGRNEVLDALWYSNIFDKSIKDLTVREMLGPAGDLNSIGQLVLGKYRLVLMCESHESSLADHFNSDDKLSEFIHNNKDRLFLTALKKHSDYIYILNIKTVQYNYDLHNRFLTKDYLKNALNIYYPIIQKFIIDAITDTLIVEEQD